mgnify:CR=1 FL=1
MGLSKQDVDRRRKQRFRFSIEIIIIIRLIIKLQRLQEHLQPNRRRILIKKLPKNRNIKISVLKMAERVTIIIEDGR